MERRFSAAARKGPGFLPDNESSEPREQDRDSSLTNFCVSPRVVGAGRGFGIHAVRARMGVLEDVRGAAGF